MKNAVTEEVNENKPKVILNRLLNNGGAKPGEINDTF